MILSKNVNFKEQCTLFINSLISKKKFPKFYHR